MRNHYECFDCQARQGCKAQEEAWSNLVEEHGRFFEKSIQAEDFAPQPCDTEGPNIRYRDPSRWHCGSPDELQEEGNRL